MKTASEAMIEPDWALIERLPLFDGIARDRIETLLRGARVQHWRRGDILFNQGDPADRFYFIAVGWVKLFRTSSAGHDSVVHVFTRGESFAEAAILADGSYPVTAAVAAPSRLLMIPAEPFLRGIEAEPAIARNMLAAMSRHLRELVGRLEQLQSQPAHRRLAGFLLSIASTDAGATEVRLPIDKALVAARLGMQPETLSRAFARLRRDGIETTSDRIQIPDIDRLRLLSQGQ